LGNRNYYIISDNKADKFPIFKRIWNLGKLIEANCELCNKF